MKEILKYNVAFIIDLLIISVWAFMSIYITAHFFGLLKNSVTTDFSGVLGIYAGVTGLATQIVSYYRGSSKGSDDKNKLLADKNPTP